MIKKITAITLILFLSVGYLPGRVVWADNSAPTGDTTVQQSPDPSPSPTNSPTPAPSSSPDPSPSPFASPSPLPSPSPSPSVLLNTADPSPLPSPSPSPSPCPSSCSGGDVNQQNDAAVTNDVSSTSNTGNNTTGISSDTQSNQATQSATLEASGSADVSGQDSSVNGSVKTGDATTNVDVVNAVNTNIADSAPAFSVKSLYVDSSGNIDLSQLSDGQTLPSALVIVGDQSNNANIVNLIYASANSGQNTALGTGDVQTGNAYSSVNLLNFINSNFFGSTIKLVVFNIFGTLNGNIVLPDNLGPAAASQSQEQGQSSGQVTQQNNANIQNSVTAVSNTGNNTAGGDVTTGSANTAVNVLNFANLNVSGGSFAQLLINNLGTWNGQFLGWGAAGPTDPIYGLMSFDFGLLGQGANGGTCGCGDLTQSNSATVSNTVVSSANTGGNNVANGSVTTGSAFSIVNIMNFINANFVNVHGFFGIINIFGTLNGDVGGASNFPDPSPSPGVQSVSTSSDSPDVHGPGGALVTGISTNVGNHVNPGDTVTFFGRVGNSGTGPVYDTKVTFKLLAPDGSLASAQSFDLGKLDAGRVANISFGLVLSSSAPAGIYSAVIDAQGKVGPNDDTVSSSANTGFLVGIPFVSAFPTGNVVPNVLAATTGDGGAGQVLAASDVASQVNWMGMLFFALGYLGMLYVAQRLFFKSWKLAVLFYSRRREVSLSREAVMAFSSRQASRFASRAMAFRHLLF